MTMKKTDLEKLRGLRIADKQGKENKLDRFGKDSSGQQTSNAPKGLLGALLKKGGK